MERPTREKVYEDYARKPVRRFLQLDGWMEDFGYGGQDEEGDAIWIGYNYDLRSSDDCIPVRVQIVEGAKYEDVMRLLPKIQKALQEYQRWEGKLDDQIFRDWSQFSNEVKQ